MTEDNRHISRDEIFEQQEQPRALHDMLKAIELARRQISLYGADHPNSGEVIEELAECVREFVASYERATCVFTKSAVIVNEHNFTISRDSIDIFHRIRARGVMAITFVGAPPVDQLREFTAFLNVEPRDIRANGSPSAYLRSKGVSRIALTEAVYTSGEACDDESNESRLEWNPENEDRAVASAIEWLARQDKDDDDDPPKLPITQILSNPDSAAKLIREAVTKLHALKRDNTSGEVAGEVLHDLKSLAGTDSEEWDKATPQIRKAISKLPADMRPSFSGFTFEDDDQTSETGAPKAEISDIETMVDDLLWDKLNSVPISVLPEPSNFERLFGARAYGPLSIWRNELQPKSVMNSTGTTLITLLRWESSACEHGRIAHALAELALRALEINNLDTALLFAGSLIEDANSDTDIGWRRSNAKSALIGLQSETLVSLIDQALATNSYDARRIAASLIDLCPEIALDLVSLLGTYSSEEFKAAFSRAIIKAGTSAATPLSNLLNCGTPTGKLAALETLVEIGRAWALEEVATVIKGEDSPLAVQALKLLPRVRIPMTSEILVEAIGHHSVEVRCAALEALGEFGDQSTLPQIVRAATHNGLVGDQTPEQLAAIEALGKIGTDEALKHLEKIASHKPLFGRNKFETIRQAAHQAAERIRNAHFEAA
ncbi:MAG: HEAT repeat domain-containing protein [Armatimonadota bacterium]|nr:HEAT repeat domain-containing protein [bacterium]